MTRPRITTLARVSLALALPAGLALTSLTLAQPARAATAITVSSCDETSLDAAIAQANTDNAGDTITFACSGTIGLTSTLDITGTMTLDGTGQQVSLSGQGQVGVLSVASGVTLTMNDLTVTGGVNSGGSGGGLDNDGGTVTITGSTFTGNTAASGAGLFNDGGTVNITNSTFTGNTAAGVGGAVLNQSAAVNITGSTFEQNAAIGGVGVMNFLDATATITGSTFAGNYDNGLDGGSAVNNPPGSTASITGSEFVQNQNVSHANGTVANGGTLSLTSSAFFENTGDGLNVGAGTATVTNSSFSEGTGGNIVTVTSGSMLNIAFSSFIGAAFPNLVGPFRGQIVGSVVDGPCAGAPAADGGYNMESGTSCGFTGTGDLQNAATGLGTLPNFFLTLAQGSPGIDAVPLSLCPATDENGNPRPDDPSETACDMGATESDYAAAATTGTSLASSPDPSVYGSPVTFTATVTPTDGGGTVAFYADGSATAIAGCSGQPLTQGSGGTWTATCTTSSLPAGSRAVSASYTGDTGYAGSTGSLAGGQTVTPAPLTITASSATMTYGAPPPAITPGYSGFVNGDDAGSLTTAPACSTTATSASPAGTYPSSCSGAADPDYAISYVTGTVTVTPAATTTAITSWANPSAAGQPVTFTATISAPPPGSGTPTGQVTFSDGDTPIGTATLTGGTAVVTTSSLTAGAHTITVSYSGDGNFTATKGSLAQAVNYSFTGFLAPVDNPPTVNMVHAGQAIPIQFSLGGNFGLGIIAAGYPTVQQVSCATGAPVNTSTETDTAGASGLQYNATTGTYTYVWKTSKAAKGTCQVFTLGLTDGTVHTALFDYVN